MESKIEGRNQDHDEWDGYDLGPLNQESHFERASIRMGKDFS
jgi:hypothetical protein